MELEGTLVSKERLALNVRLNRARKHWSQQELSKRSGVATATISFIENAKKKEPCRMATLVKLADAFGIGLRELLEERI